MKLLTSLLIILMSLFIIAMTDIAPLYYTLLRIAAPFLLWFLTLLNFAYHDNEKWGSPIFNFPTIASFLLVILFYTGAPYGSSNEYWLIFAGIAAALMLATSIYYFVRTANKRKKSKQQEASPVVISLATQYDPTDKSV